MTGSVATARAAWSCLDDAWRLAFSLAWEAVTTGNIGVGAVATSPTGALIGGRNRVADTSAPPGEVAGSSLAHAEMNVIAQIPFRSAREFVLTTTLQPCLQCSAAVRMAPIATIRIAGADPLWDGCHDFTSLSSWVARREPVPIEGPRIDEIGVFGTLVSRFGPGLIPRVEDALRSAEQGPTCDLARSIEAENRLEELVKLPVNRALEVLWPDLRRIVDGTRR